MTIGSSVPGVPRIAAVPTPAVVAAFPAAVPNPAVAAAFPAAVPTPAAAEAVHRPA
jgi:hypothetical protein